MIESIELLFLRTKDGMDYYEILFKIIKKYFITIIISLLYACVTRHYCLVENISIQSLVL